MAFALALTLSGVRSHAETGYNLWLRYIQVDDVTKLSAYRKSVGSLVVEGTSPSLEAARNELRSGLEGLLGQKIRESATLADGALVLGTPASSKAIAALGWKKDLKAAGPDGFVIRSTQIGGHPATVIASSTEVGALYGAFHFLRLIQTQQPLSSLNVIESPRISRRFLNHWDNLDGTIERGYGGRSMWNGIDISADGHKRLIDYARANASLGINSVSINNVNASPLALDTPYLQKAKTLADLWRPYGIRVYISANFSAPKTLGNLKTADPLDPQVALWWKKKADEIYALIPDCGGFLVKANSEGQPGPQDYKRSHADGANVMADALAPHNGIVLWRAFVYNAEVDPDRVKRAYKEFVPLDGAFRENVLVQVKNGPLDFQPREPFSPLFGATMKTPLVPELQVAQEYLGQGTHLVYLAPMWKELLDSDTYAKGPGSTVARVIDGSLYGQRLTAIAAVSNTGNDLNWTGHDFAQANWYAYGRLAWNPSLRAEAIADEWLQMTWGSSKEMRAALRGLMLESRESFVDYTMPMGLHHLIGGDHYAPMPENNDPRRSDWSATTYHHAGEDGIGYDRTPAGSGAVLQYNSPLKEEWAKPETTPERLLLWFHHLPWDFKTKSGRPLWDELVAHYTAGALWARGLEARWAKVRPFVDQERYEAVRSKLHQQAIDAAAWRAKCLGYFQTFSKRPIPPLDPPPSS
ncbi:MAG: alpha-glucuronidase family glycosyl hydrolase [Vicinamibacteria bacterium]